MQTFSPLPPPPPSVTPAPGSATPGGSPFQTFLARGHLCALLMLPSLPGELTRCAPPLLCPESVAGSSGLSSDPRVLVRAQVKLPHPPFILGQLSNSSHLLGSPCMLAQWKYSTYITSFNTKTCCCLQVKKLKRRPEAVATETHTGQLDSSEAALTWGDVSPAHYPSLVPCLSQPHLVLATTL